MNASIITIGDEILIGQITNTNSQWIATKLNTIGIKVDSMLTVGDNEEQIINSLNDQISNYDFIFITGGLGPTNDDITKKVLSDYFNKKLVYNETVYENMKSLFGGKIEINKNNLSQAYIPEDTGILINKYGTAPGMLFQRNNSYIFSLPGVPAEMQYLFEHEVIPFIKNKFTLPEITHKTLIIAGLPESILAEKISDWENSLPLNIKLAYLPSYGYIRLRLSIYNSDNNEKETINKKIEELKKIITHNIISEDDLLPEELLGKVLKAKGQTVSIAESSTGGKISSMLTSISGSSEYFMGSIVSYSNSVKINTLNVDREDIERYGAVSKAVVEQMAMNVLNLLKTDYSIATSGVAGPDGGTSEKPVGTTWIAVASKEKVISKEFHFSGSRATNILRAANNGIVMLINEILK